MKRYLCIKSIVSHENGNHFTAGSEYELFVTKDKHKMEFKKSDKNIGGILYTDSFNEYFKEIILELEPEIVL